MKLENIHHPHDPLFKNAMSDLVIAQDFFKQHLPPALLARMDLNTLELCSATNTFDILYSVRIDGHLAYIYLLTEPQKQMRPCMPVDVVGYKHEIWKRHIKEHPGTKLPIIIPIVFYNGETRYTASTCLKDFMAGPIDFIEEHLHQDFILIDTHDLKDEALRNQTWGGTLAFFMKHVHARDVIKRVREVIGSLLTLVRLGYEPFVVGLLKYYLSEAKGFNLKIYIGIVQQYCSAEIVGKVMNMAQQLRNEGRQEGVVIGIEQGVQQGVAIVLLHLLQHKFGKVPADYLAKIEVADSELLLAWAKRLLIVSSLEGLFNEIAVH